MWSDSDEWTEVPQRTHNLSGTASRREFAAPLSKHTHFGQVCSRVPTVPD